MVLYAGPEATVPPAELELMKGGKSYHTTSRPKLIEKEGCAGLRYLCPASAGAAASQISDKQAS